MQISIKSDLKKFEGNNCSISEYRRVVTPKELYQISKEWSIVRQRNGIYPIIIGLRFVRASSYIRGTQIVGGGQYSLYSIFIFTRINGRIYSTSFSEGVLDDQGILNVSCEDECFILLELSYITRLNESSGGLIRTSVWKVPGVVRNQLDYMKMVKDYHEPKCLRIVQ